MSVDGPNPRLAFMNAWLLAFAVEGLSAYFIEEPASTLDYIRQGGHADVFVEHLPNGIAGAGSTSPSRQPRIQDQTLYNEIRMHVPTAAIIVLADAPTTLPSTIPPIETNTAWMFSVKAAPAAVASFIAAWHGVWNTREPARRREALEKLMTVVRRELWTLELDELAMANALQLLASYGEMRDIEVIDGLLTLRPGLPEQIVEMARAAQRFIERGATEVAMIAEVQSPVPNPALPWLQGADPAELWTIIRTAGEDLSRRKTALAELVEREDPDVPAFLVAELSRRDLEPRWREALIVLSERVLFHDPAHQASLTESLRRHALDLRDTPEACAQEALWAAVWRYGTLVPDADVGTLLDFLRPEDPATTKQVALQSVANVFSRHAPAPSLPLEALRRRVEDLTVHYLDIEWVISPENGSLTISAFCAAAALASPRLAEFATSAIALKKPWMIHQLLQELGPMALAWRREVEAGGGAPEATGALETAIAQLRAAQASPAE